jgi:hypothetical protein
MGDPAFLKGVLSFRMQTLNGYDFGAVHRGKWPHAGPERGAVDEHGAGSALADTAAILCAGQLKVFAYDPQKRGLSRQVNGGGFSIDCKGCHGRPPFHEARLFHIHSQILFLKDATCLVQKNMGPNRQILQREDKKLLYQHGEVEKGEMCFGFSCSRTSK